MATESGVSWAGKVVAGPNAPAPVPSSAAPAGGDQAASTTNAERRTPAGVHERARVSVDGSLRWTICLSSVNPAGASAQYRALAEDVEQAIDAGRRQRRSGNGI